MTRHNTTRHDTTRHNTTRQNEQTHKHTHLVLRLRRFVRSKQVDDAYNTSSTLTQKNIINEVAQTKKRKKKTLSKAPVSSILHTVALGDTLYSIARKYNVALEALIRLNTIENNTIYPGQKLKVPQ